MSYRPHTSTNVYRFTQIVPDQSVNAHHRSLQIRVQCAYIPEHTNNDHTPPRYVSLREHVHINHILQTSPVHTFQTMQVCGEDLCDLYRDLICPTWERVGVVTWGAAAATGAFVCRRALASFERSESIVG